MKALYKYPQDEYPYCHLERVNRERTVEEAEYELEDTGGCLVHLMSSPNEFSWGCKFVDGVAILSKIRCHEDSFGALAKCCVTGSEMWVVIIDWNIFQIPVIRFAYARCNVMKVFIMIIQITNYTTAD